MMIERNEKRKITTTFAWLNCLGRMNMNIEQNWSYEWWTQQKKKKQNQQQHKVFSVCERDERTNAAQTKTNYCY